MTFRYDAVMMQPGTGIVLYVEDEESDILFLKRTLLKQRVSADLRTASTGEEAIDYLDAGQVFRKSCPVPDVVLLDLNLPGSSGFEVLTWIRQQMRFQDLSVVVFTSSDHPEDRVRAKSLGATDFWVKPSSIDELGDLVSRLQREYLPHAHSERRNRRAPHQTNRPTNPQRPVGERLHGYQGPTSATTDLTHFT